MVSWRVGWHSVGSGPSGGAVSRVEPKLLGRVLLRGRACGVSSDSKRCRASGVRERENEREKEEEEKRSEERREI